MEITVNGEKRIFDESSVTIMDLLARLEVKFPNTVTVQLNDKFVPGDGFDLTKVRDGDRLDFLYFVGGGRNSEFG
jgi:thiamine biosynthesis protein ThiS